MWQARLSYPDFEVTDIRLSALFHAISWIFAKCFETDHMISSERTQKQNLSFDYSFAAVGPTGLIGVVEMQKTSNKTEFETCKRQARLQFCRI